VVPIDFHAYRREIKKALLAQTEALATEWDGFVAAWIAYGLSAEGFECNGPLSELAERLERWRRDEQTWGLHRNVGPLAFSCWLQRQLGSPWDDAAFGRLGARVSGLTADDKLGVLRDPEQVFLLALGLGPAAQSKEPVVAAARRQLDKGPLKRRILYAASLRELGEMADIPSAKVQDDGDLVALVWWAERYTEKVPRHEQWEAYTKSMERISLTAADASESQRVLSVPELALLYEAATKQSRDPDPVLLFEYFPMHPRIRQVAGEHFRNGKYVVAVEQAAKVLNELIQQKSGVTDKSEAELVQATMKQIGNPADLRIRFNAALNEQSGKNEQAGLALICEGVFKAFRNPKGHKPEDDPLIQVEPYEALAQIVMISYLMKRIEDATRSGEGHP